MRTPLLLVLVLLVWSAFSTNVSCSKPGKYCDFRACKWYSMTTLLRSDTENYTISKDGYSPTSGLYKLSLTVGSVGLSGEVDAKGLNEPFATHQSVNGRYANCGTGNSSEAMVVDGELFVPTNNSAPSPLPSFLVSALRLTGVPSFTCVDYSQDCDHDYFPAICNFSCSSTNFSVTNAFIFPYRFTPVTPYAPYFLENGTLTAKFEERNSSKKCKKCFMLTSNTIFSTCDQVYYKGELLVPSGLPSYKIRGSGLVVGIFNGTIFEEQHEKRETGKFLLDVTDWEHILAYLVILGLCLIAYLIIKVISMTFVGAKFAKYFWFFIDGLLCVILCPLILLAWLYSWILFKLEEAQWRRKHEKLFCETCETAGVQCTHFDPTEPAPLRAKRYFRRAYVDSLPSPASRLFIMVFVILLVIRVTKAECTIESVGSANDIYLCSSADKIKISYGNVTDDLSFKVRTQHYLDNSSVTSVYFPNKRCVRNSCNVEYELTVGQHAIVGYTTSQAAGAGVKTCFFNDTGDYQNWETTVYSLGLVQCQSIPATGGKYAIQGTWSGPYMTGDVFDQNGKATTVVEGVFTQVSALASVAMPRVDKKLQSGLIMKNSAGNPHVYSVADMPLGTGMAVLGHMRCALAGIMSDSDQGENHCSDNLLDIISVVNIAKVEGCHKLGLGDEGQFFEKLTRSTMSLMGQGCMKQHKLSLTTENWDGSTNLCGVDTYENYEYFNGNMSGSPRVSLSANFTCSESAYAHMVRISVPGGAIVSTDSCGWISFDMSFETDGESTFLTVNGVSKNPSGEFVITCPKAVVASITIPCFSGTNKYLIDGFPVNQYCYTTAQGKIVRVDGQIVPLVSQEALNLGITELQNEFLSQSNSTKKKGIPVDKACSGALCVLNKIALIWDAVIFSWLWPSCFHSLWNKLPGVSDACEVVRWLGYFMWILFIAIAVYILSKLKQMTSKKSK